MIPDNARILRITAAAGTELADAYSTGTLIGPRVALIALRQKRFTTHRALVPHAAWLDQSCLHCPIFLTAASRRSLGRVSVPMWGVFLSEPLCIVALVGRCPANWLMHREPIRDHLGFQTNPMRDPLLRGVSRRFHRLSPCHGQVAHVFRTLPPVAARVLLPRAAPRLACVKPAASVHPEPGGINALDFPCFGTCFPVLSLNIFKGLKYLFSRKGIAKIHLFFEPANFFWNFFLIFSKS